MPPIDEPGAVAPVPATVAETPTPVAMPARKSKPVPVPRSPFVVTASVAVTTGEAGETVNLEPGAVVALTAAQASAHSAALRPAADIDLSRLGHTPAAI